jgi:hypothetical protein
MAEMRRWNFDSPHPEDSGDAVNHLGPWLIFSTNFLGTIHYDLQF